MQNEQVASTQFQKIPWPRARMMLRFYLWLMGWSGAINSWAWKKQAEIIKNKQRLQMEKIIRNQKNREYLEELKKWK